MTLILGLLTIITGSAFAWYRIKTRGLATVLEDIWRFVAIQNSKDVAAYNATKRLLIILWGRSSGRTQQLYDQYQQKEKERTANWEREEKERATHRAQQTRERQPRQRSPKYALPTWIVPPQHDELNRKMGQEIFNYAIICLVIICLPFIFIFLMILGANQ